MLQTSLPDPLQENQLFINRAVVAGLFVVLALMALSVRLAHLQIVSHEHFRTLSRDNRVKLEPLPPSRGLIYDANGVLLAENLTSFNLEITPDKVDNLPTTIEQLAKLLPISDVDRRRFERLRKQTHRFASIPIRTQLTELEVARFSVESHRFPGVDVRAALIRHYPWGEQTAHVLGYVGRISEEELKNIQASLYSGTSFIGKNGVEKAYEKMLYGKVGMQQVEVNAKGRVLRVLESQAPESGYDLHLYLDLGLQGEALKALGNKNGAIVAIDPQTGGVLAMASHPTFNPNQFVLGISGADYRALQESPDRPLYNRAVRGQYPPGSTIKPFVALAGLETGEIHSHDSVYCPGYYQLPGQDHKYRDWRKGGHGRMDMDSAIVQSCDVYFYNLARNLGVDQLGQFLGRFGFGRVTGVDMTNELPGVLPSREWKQGRRSEPWFPGETLIMGIGQGYFLVTPTQLASATATLAARGRYIRPRVVKAVQGAATNGKLQDLEPEITQLPQRNKRHWNEVIQAMTRVVESPNGTAKRIATKAYSIAGKTGTAQVFTVKQSESYDERRVQEKMRDHALFIAFAPVDDPRIAVAVIIEHGGHGGATAAPIAKRIMDRYLLGEGQFTETDETVGENSD